MPMELEGEGWVRVRPMEWDAYYLAVQFVSIARGKALNAEELRPRVRFLHSIYRRAEDRDERKELSSLVGPNAAAISEMMGAAPLLLPEFAFLCTVIQLLDEEAQTTTDAYAVIVWQANRPGPRLALCLDVAHPRWVSATRTPRSPGGTSGAGCAGVVPGVPEPASREARRDDEDPQPDARVRRPDGGLVPRDREAGGRASRGPRDTRSVVGLSSRGEVR